MSAGERISYSTMIRLCSTVSRNVHFRGIDFEEIRGVRWLSRSAVGVVRFDWSCFKIGFIATEVRGCEEVFSMYSVFNGCSLLQVRSVSMI